MAATKFFLFIDPFAGMLKDDAPIVFSTDDPNTVIELLFYSEEGCAVFRHISSDASVVPTTLYNLAIKREGSRIDGKFVGGGYSETESLIMAAEDFMTNRLGLEPG